MFTIRTLLLASATAALLWTNPAFASEEDPPDDAPIATAPLEPVTAMEPILLEEPETLPEPRVYGPWLTQQPSSTELTGVATIGLQHGYFYRYYGFDVANGKTTSQATVSVSYGDFSSEIGGSKLLESKDSPRSSERLANEYWVGLAYRPEFETVVGRFRFDFAVVYRGLDHGQGLGAIRDDSTELVAGVGYPRTFGQLEIMPHVLSVKSNPVGYNNSLYFAGVGLATKWRLPRYGIALSADVMDWHNVNSTTAVIHRNVTTLSLAASRTLSKTGWTGTVGVTVSRYSTQDGRFDMFVERDGRLLRTTQASSAGLTANPYFRFAYAF
jgi:hypothetical protein